jgi:hypothetical protein
MVADAGLQVALCALLFTRRTFFNGSAELKFMLEPAVQPLHTQGVESSCHQKGYTPQ